MLGEKKDSDDSDLDFGDDDDDESDEEYDDGNLKPWQRKARQAKPTLSGLDREASDEEMADGDGERGGDMQKSKAAEATLEDFVKVTIPRRRLSRWCNEPFFEAAIRNCFVKLFVGEDDSGKKCYRLCEIVDVKSGGLTYKFPVANKHDKQVSIRRR